MWGWRISSIDADSSSNNSRRFSYYEVFITETTCRDGGKPKEDDGAVSGGTFTEDKYRHFHPFQA